VALAGGSPLTPRDCPPGKHARNGDPELGTRPHQLEPARPKAAALVQLLGRVVARDEPDHKLLDPESLQLGVDRVEQAAANPSSPVARGHDERFELGGNGRDAPGIEFVRVALEHPNDRIPGVESAAARHE
jgi:hypothetical protein